MATWGEIQAHMRARYRLTVDEAEVLAMAWAYADGRHQRIVVRRHQTAGREVVEFKSPFATYGGPDPLELLRENLRLTVGAVALSGDVYVLVHNEDLAALTLARLDELLGRVAAQADRLEGRFGLKDQF